MPLWSLLQREGDDHGGRVVLHGGVGEDDAKLRPEMQDGASSKTWSDGDAENDCKQSFESKSAW